MILLGSRRGRWIKLGVIIALPVALLFVVIEILSWRPRILEDPAGRRGYVYSVTFSPDGRFVAGATYQRITQTRSGGEIEIWDARAGRMVKRFPTSKIWQSFAVAYTSDGKTLAASVYSQAIRIYNADTGKLQRVLKSPDKFRQDAVLGLAFLPNSKMLAVADRVGSLGLWDVQREKLKWAIDWPKVGGGSVFSLAVSPDGKVLACACAHAMVQLRDAQTGKLLRTLRGFRKSVTAVAFSPDGQTLATGCGDPGISGGDLKLLAQLRKNKSDNTVQLWSTGTWQWRRTLVGHSEGITALSFSPDGKMLASGSDDDTIKVWSTHNGQLLRTLIGHQNTVWSVAFAPDGGTLASGSMDNTARLWRIK